MKLAKDVAPSVQYSEDVCRKAAVKAARAALKALSKDRDYETALSSAQALQRDIIKASACSQLHGVLVRSTETKGDNQ